MIEQVINSILEAEQKAEEIITNANLTAKATELATEIEVQAVYSSAINSFKDYRKKQLLETDAVAEKEYNQIIAAGQAEAEALNEQTKPLIDKVSDIILGRIVG